MIDRLCVSASCLHTKPGSADCNLDQDPDEERHVNAALGQHMGLLIFPMHVTHKLEVVKSAHEKVYVDL